MDKITAYLEKQDAIIAEDREKTLIALGLTEREYSPDGRESREYSLYDYYMGEKRYYREVAIPVSDDEYALIISKAEQVEYIEEKEKLERQREREGKKRRIIRKWIPVFEKPKDDSVFADEKEQVENGKSKIASILRGVAWITGFLFVVCGIIVADGARAFSPILIFICAGALEMLMFYALAAILDYLAELTAIVRNGFKYDESNK